MFKLLHNWAVGGCHVGLGRGWGWLLQLYSCSYWLEEGVRQQRLVVVGLCL